MTIETLRARKLDLMARRQQLEQSGADKLSLALLNEELMDANAQLRTLTHGGRRSKRTTNSSSAQDRQQFDAWASREDREEAAQGREQLRAAAAESLEGLSKAQRETLELYTAGMSQMEIAAKLGLSPSTVSRNLSRAKRNAADAVSRAVERRKLLDTGNRVDLIREDTIRAVVMAMTTKQLVYFYLYYSERLNQREIGELLGVDHSTICRTINRALLKLDKLFGGQPVVVTHPEAIDQAAYLAWLELEAHPELVPEPAKPLLAKRKKQPAEYYRKYRRVTFADPHTTVLRTKKGKPGQLLCALQERAKTGAAGMIQWLKSVFFRLKQTLKERK